MDTRESLTVRTVTALQRLADLENRGRTLTGPKAGVLKSALHELESALEELRVASEHLNEMMDTVAEARADAGKVEALFEEFREVLPVSCLLTDAAGQIADANSAAGDLLNVAPRHLNGKPLSLYMVQRDQFFTLMRAARLAPELARAELMVRPRERKPRVMSVQLVQLRRDDRLCWFLQDPTRQPQAA